MPALKYVFQTDKWYKECSVCHKFKEETSQFFPTRKTKVLNRYNLRGPCRDCYNTQRRKRYKTIKNIHYLRSIVAPGDFMKEFINIWDSNKENRIFKNVI